MKRYALCFATCRCGFRTPIQLSMPDSLGKCRTWIETGGEFPYVACKGCNRLYKPQELSSDTSMTAGEGERGTLDSQGGSLHMFHASIECVEDFRCPPIKAVLVANSATSDEDALKEFLTYRGVVTCPNGHVQRFPDAGWTVIR